MTWRLTLVNVCGHVTCLIYRSGGGGIQWRHGILLLRKFAAGESSWVGITLVVWQLWRGPKASSTRLVVGITPNTRPRPTPVARSTLKEIVTSWNRASSAHTHIHTHTPTLFSFSPHDTAGFPSSIAVSQEITQGSGGTSRCLPLWRL